MSHILTHVNPKAIFTCCSNLNIREVTWEWYICSTDFTYKMHHYTCSIKGIIKLAYECLLWLTGVSDLLNFWMLGNFLKIDYIVVCFLKPVNSACFFWVMIDWVANRLDLRPAWVTRQLAWIQPVCISINAVPALKGLR